MERRGPNGLWSALTATLACLVGCSGGGGGPGADPAWVPGSGLTAPTARPFSGERAVDDAERIAERAPRLPGSREAERTRAWLAEQLAEMGATVEALGAASSDADADGPPTPLVASLAGESTDILLLVAPYDTAVDEEGDSVAGLDAAAGPAVLLELGRSLAARRRPYTVWLAFVEGDASASGERTDFAGSQALASLLDRNDALRRIRLTVFFDALGRPELRIVRDLRSHRVHREVFWDSARQLGLVEVFVPDAAFGSPAAGHRALLESPLRGVVGIMGEALPVDAAERELDDQEIALLAQRLDELGAVTLDALDAIAERLSRIDRFSEAPLSAERWEGADESGAAADPDDSGPAPAAAESQR